MHSVIAYTAARLALFAATAGVLYLLGARGLLLIAVAVLVSGLVSLVVLSRQRDAMSTAVLAGARKGRRAIERKVEESRTREDDPAG